MSATTLFNATPAPSGNVQFSTQAARGQAYYDALTSNFNSMPRIVGQARFGPRIERIYTEKFTRHLRGSVPVRLQFAPTSGAHYEPVVRDV